jgi:serine/threonine protein phosphatase PrpC
MTVNGNVNEPEQERRGGQEQDAAAAGRAAPDTETADTHSDAALTAAQPAERAEAGQAESVCTGASPPEEPVETTVVEIPAAPEQAPAAPIPRRTIPHSPRRLPNCRITGVNYRASLADVLAQFSGQEVQGIGVSENGAGNLALQWNASTVEISCHPMKAGEFEIEFCVDVRPNERHVFPFMLTVNPDPKTLWKNIPSDPNGVYAKADSAKVFLTCAPGLSIAAASQRGRSHAQEGKPRDDDFAIHYDAETDCSFLLVADGAGSAKFSREGSRIAVLTALEKMRSVMNAEFWSALMPSIERWVTDKDANADKSIKKALYVLIQAAWDAKARIKQEAKDHQTRFAAAYKKAESFTARDYATTLILTVVKSLESGGWFVATYWVGDGGMGIYREGAADVSVQGTPDGGEYGGQTRFLTEDSVEVWPQDANKLIARRLRFEVVDSFDAVILMTDGVTDPKFETERNLVSMAKWNDLWAELANAVPFKNRDDSVAAALLEWMDFWSPGNHDDRTMVVLY